PVLNRSLLVRYLRVLRTLGLDERLLRWWSWWFSAASRALYAPASTADAAPTHDICSDLARLHAPCFVVHSDLVTPPPAAADWLAATAFIRGFELPDPAAPA